MKKPKKVAPLNMQQVLQVRQATKFVEGTLQLLGNGKKESKTKAEAISLARDCAYDLTLISNEYPDHTELKTAIDSIYKFINTIPNAS